MPACQTKFLQSNASLSKPATNEFNSDSLLVPFLTSLDDKITKVINKERRYLNVITFNLSSLGKPDLNIILRTCVVTASFTFQGLNKFSNALLLIKFLEKTDKLFLLENAFK